MSTETGYIDGVQTATYRIWAGMKNRCLNPKNKDYRYYGGRGITVCERWLVYANFLADMGERPDGLSIDRFPNKDGNYEPGNCRWATQKQQRENTSNFRGLDYAQLEVTSQAVSQRLHRGWTPEDAMSIKRSNRWKQGKRIT